MRTFCPDLTELRREDELQGPEKTALVQLVKAHDENLRLLVHLAIAMLSGNPWNVWVTMDGFSGSWFDDCKYNKLPVVINNMDVALLPGIKTRDIPVAVMLLKRIRSIRFAPLMSAGEHHAREFNYQRTDAEHLTLQSKSMENKTLRKWLAAQEAYERGQKIEKRRPDWKKRVDLYEQMLRIFCKDFGLPSASETRLPYNAECPALALPTGGCANVAGELLDLFEALVVRFSRRFNYKRSPVRRGAAHILANRDGMRWDDKKTSSNHFGGSPGHVWDHQT